MRIREIIEALVEPVKRELPVSTPFNLKKMGQRTQKTIDNPDTGAYAVGTTDPRDPHMFRKKMRQPSKLDVDAYYQYIKYIEPYSDSNPFFPKVYGVDVKRDPNGLEKPSYRIEKLVDIDQADQRMDYQLEDALKDRYLVNNAAGSIVSIIRNAISGSFNLKNIKDGKLVQAIQLIQKFLDDHPKFELDLHRGNVMIRFTSVGPQLVITDPVQDRGASIVGYNVFKGGWAAGGSMADPGELATMKNSKLLSVFRGTAEDVRRQLKEVVRGNQDILKTPEGQQLMKLFTDTVYIRLEYFEKDITKFKNFVLNQQQRGTDSLPVNYGIEDMPEVMAQLIHGMAMATKDAKQRNLFTELRDRVRMYAK